MGKLRACSMVLSDFVFAPASLQGDKGAMPNHGKEVQSSRGPPPPRLG